MAAANQSVGDQSSEVESDLSRIDSVVGSPLGAADAAFAQVSGGKLAVNHDNVRQAAKIVQDHVDQLNDVTRLKARGLRMSNFAEDFISMDVVDSWNKLLVDNPDSYAHRIGEYIDSLEKLADQLRTAARQYGYTEDQIKASFGDQQ